MNDEHEPLQESKIEATKRLQREGRWEEASAYRCEVRKQQRAQGKTKAEAGEIAWRMTIEKYPPLGAEQEAEGADLDDVPPQQLDELVERTAGQGVDLTDMISFGRMRTWPTRRWFLRMRRPWAHGAC